MHFNHSHRLSVPLASLLGHPELGGSYWTVETHVAHIYKKLHVHSRAQAVAKYFGIFWKLMFCKMCYTYLGGYVIFLTEQESRGGIHG